MHDISNPSEARELLEKDDFSVADSRALLLYLIQRDELWKQNAEKINAAFLALFQVAATMMAALSKMPLSPELKSQLDRTTEALTDLHDLIKTDLSVH
jgi:hypothetical protein